MRPLTVLLALLTSVMSSRLRAQVDGPPDANLVAVAGDEGVAGTGAGAAQVFDQPEYPLELSLGVGFRYLEAKGSTRAAEYERLESYPTFVGEVAAIPGWNRVHLRAELRNPHDFFVDGSYAYRDLAMVRWISHTVYHNLEGTDLIDLGSDPRYGILDNAGGAPFGLTSGLHQLDLRLKLPDFPAHFAVSSQLTTKNGDREQRFLGGSGSFDLLERTVERRPVDWLGLNVRAGLNAHLGPVEAEVYHQERWRRIGRGAGLVYDYRGSAARGAGDYRLAVLGDGRGRTDGLRLHSSYTGRLVGALTLSREALDSELSGANSTALVGSASLTWMPVSPVVIALRAHYRDLALRNPETVSSGQVGDASAGERLPTRPSLSTTTGRLSVDARYRALKGLTLRGDFNQRTRYRRHARAWEMPLRTVQNRGGFGVDLRAHRTVRIEAAYRRQEVDAPSHNTEMDSSDWLTTELGWTPLPQLALRARYEGEVGRRRNLTYVVDSERIEIGRGDKRRHNLTVSVQLDLGSDVALHGHYAFISLDDEMTMVYEAFDDAAPPLADAMVPYQEKIHMAGISLHLRPFTDLRVRATAYYTLSRAGFFPTLEAALAPLSIAAFSRERVRELVANIEATYEVTSGWFLTLNGATRRLDHLRNLNANPRRDGDIWAALAIVSRKWK